MTRLPGGGWGTYYSHRQMGGTLHGFARLPLCLAAETTMTAASAGGPAGSLPRLCARRQARAAACDDDNENEDDRIQRAMKALAAGNTRATRCASGRRPAVGGRRPATQSSTIAGWRAMTKRAANKRKQQPTIAH